MSVVASLKTNISELLHPGLSKVAGVEVVAKANGIFVFNGVVLEKKKQTLNTLVKQSGLEGFSDLKKFLPETIPVTINLGGRGVMFRKFAPGNQTDEQLLQAILPNANPSDFYFQVLKNEEGIFCCISRKQWVNEILNEFKKAKIQVIGCSLGPCVIELLLPYINGGNALLPVTGFDIQSAAGKIKDISVSSISKLQSFEIASEPVSNDHLIAYAASFQLLVFPGSALEIPIPSVLIEKSEWEYSNKFKITGWAILGFFLCILLGNFFFFHHYNEKNQSLLSQQGLYATQVERVEKMKTEVIQKETFLTSAGWLNPSNLSLFSDQIASTVPASIKLTQLAIYPVNERQSRQEKRKIFDNQTTIVKGTCFNPTDLNPWMVKIKALEWVSSASVTHYSFDDSENKGNFEVTIHLKN